MGPRKHALVSLSTDDVKSVSVCAGVVQDFAEKPSKEAIESGRWQVSGGDGKGGEGPFEASMGIYCFKRTSLEALLTTGKAAAAVNFGHVRLLPCLVCNVSLVCRVPEIEIHRHFVGCGRFPPCQARRGYYDSPSFLIISVGDQNHGIWLFCNGIPATCPG